ncbi:MAG: T9SS type A sorting domain-containing protein, partial [Bacteroidales bacterium]|nr:T9SS type A sorting domain-containing protein [Bacteroidales bacterium]
QVTPSGAFTQIGWAVNSPSGWVSTVPSDEYNHSWTNGTGGVVYVETTDNNGCVAHGEMMVFDCCANPETTISFFNETLTSPQTYWHEVISVNGTLTIDANGTTSFYDCHFYMGVNAKIVITSNDIVNIGYHTKNAPQTIIEACDSLMWDGIYINDNTAKLYVYYSKIYDAKNAVVSLHGGVFDIKTSLFDKNYKHLDIRTYNGTHLGSITESVLTCSGTLFPQYPFIQGATKTRYAVSVSRAANVTIGDPQSISLQNTIEKCDVGIYCLNSGVKVYNNKFQNISVPVNLPISVKKGFGIFAEKAVNYISPVSSLTVGGSGNLPGVGNFRRNVFIDVTNGVYTYQYSNIAINNNTFEIQNPTTAESKALMIYDYAHFTGTKCITNNTISNYRTGVFLNDVESMSVRDNDISDFQISQTGGYSYGIRMLGGNDVLIYGNTIENSSIYANTEGIRVSTSPLSTVQCNTIKNMGKSIHLQGTMMPFTLRQNRMENGIDALVFTNATIGTQGTSSNPQGNTWYGNFSNCQTLFDNCYGTNSSFYIKPNVHTLPSVNCTVGINSGAFEFTQTNHNTWPGCVMVMPVAANPSSLYSIANDQIGYAQFEQENKWMARKQVLLAMKKDSISGDPLLSQFSLSQQNTGTAISLSVEDTLKVDPATAETLNSLMPETNFNETATKLVNNVFFEKEADTTMLPADLNISSLSADSLRWLAQQCPFEFGKAVYQARMLLSLIDTTEYMNLCEAGSAGFSDKSVQSFSTDSFNISVSPNPFANELKIEFENPEECTGFVCLMDLTGKVIATYELPEKAAQFVIRTDEIAEGIYYLKVWNDNNLLKYSKIVKY